MVVCSLPREQKRSHRSHRVPVCTHRRSESLLPSGLWLRHLRGGRGVPRLVMEKNLKSLQTLYCKKIPQFCPLYLFLLRPRLRHAPSPRHCREMARSHMHLDHAATPVGFAPSVSQPRPAPQEKIRSPRARYHILTEFQKSRFVYAYGLS